MTDREMLEKAAKAAGVFLTPTSLAALFPKWDWCDEFEPYYREGGGMVGAVAVYSYTGKLSGTTSQEWNPLEDDGDALRLAVDLKILVDPRSSLKSASAHGKSYSFHEMHSSPNAATRRAITRAAAALADSK